MRSLRSMVALAAIYALAACSASAPGRQTGAATTGPAVASARPTAPDHVLVVVFENKSDQQVAGSTAAPWFNQVIAQAALFTRATAVTHPSQPNYLALFSGATQGLTSDRCPFTLHDKPNLARQLLDSGHTFAAYSEDLPSVGYLGCTSGGYAAKHDPWAHFDNVPAAVQLPFSAFPTDYSTLPTVGFVIPNLCHDMHDCGVATGDSWAASHLSGYLAWARTHNSVLVVTFDENDNRAGNQILTMIAGGLVKPGSYPETVDHYSILATIEHWYGLAPLGEAAQRAPLVDFGYPGA